MAAQQQPGNTPVAPVPEEEPVAASLLEALLQEAKKQTTLLEKVAWATKRQEANSTVE